MRFDKLHILADDYFEPMLISADAKGKRRELTEYLTDAFLYVFSVYEVHSLYNSMLAKALYEQLLADKISDAVSQVTGIDDYMSKHIRKVAKEVVDTTFKNAQVRQNLIDNTYSKKNQNTPKPSNNSDAALADHEELLAHPLKSNSSANDSHVSDPMPLVSEEDDEVEETMENEAVAEYWLSIHRAALIARNEANAFLNYSDYVEAKNSGKKTKTWLTMEDSKVRATHEEVEGQTIGIDETFEVGNSEMRFPLDDMFSPDPNEVVNCRCSVEYK